MQNKKIKLITLLLIGLGLTSLQAQEVIPTTGGNASGTGGTVSYSVGQIVYTTSTGTNGSVVQGVQQPFEISVVSSIVEGEGINLAFSAYPNPTTNLLILKIDVSTPSNNAQGEPFNIKSMSYQLFDISGKLLDSKKVESTETSIDMNNLVPAIYFLKVNNNNKEIKTFKIIKTQ